jgi:integrase
MIAAIIKAYEASPEWARLAASTRRYCRRNHATIEAALGWMGLADLNAKRARSEFYALRDSLADRPATSMLVIASLKTLLSWAEKRSLIEHNWCKGVENLYPGGRREELVWTPELQQAFLTACGRPDMASMFEFSALTAIRVGDMLALTWAQFDGRWIRYKPKKTKGKDSLLTVSLPVFALGPLAQLLDAMPRGADADPIFRVITATEPEDNGQGILHTQFARVRQRIGAEHLHWHDLRGTAISALFAAGCSDAEVASISGHKIGGRSMLGAYAARGDDLALNAFHKLDAHLSRPAVVVPFPLRSVS